ncbi:MAG TPA: NAD(P)/FAD-dependent oxidoreductase [Candidatus Limnocylindrales bacterium]|nr:NAD(P)/FAD-dependent oxidoreductase [Candidatus Limnocylindrales bacterium]
MTTNIETCEVAIVGGGPAGLSAALVLGRCRRRVVLFDSGEYRNAASHAMHGFLSRDGLAPSELRRIAREEIARYETVEFRSERVENAVATGKGFELTTQSGRALRCRKLLIATGLVDDLPDVAGTEELYGKSIHHCPYCEGWEVRDQPLAAYGCGDGAGGGIAVELLLWSRDVVLCTNGPCGLTDEYRAKLERFRIGLREERVRRFEGDESRIRIIFESGEVLERRALFFNTGSRQRSDLARRLGCEFDERGGVRCVKFQSTCVPGVYVAGDASRDALQVIVAAGEGSEAAVGINKALVEEDLL